MLTPVPDPQKSFAEQTPAILLACLVFGEARGEVFEGKLAVANVATNRLRTRGFGSGLAQVILKPFQFSCFNLSDPNRTKLLDPEKWADWPVWADCYFAATLALSRNAADPSIGAVFYHDSTLSRPPSDWGPVAETASIGRLTFYKIENLQSGLPVAA